MRAHPLLLLLLSACWSEEGPDPTAFTIVHPPDTGGTGDDESWGCVTNLATGRIYIHLQDAFDEARAGDVLELCDWRLTSGGESPVSVSLRGGAVYGTVSLPGGGVNGTTVPRLEVESGAIFVQDALVAELVVGGTVEVDGGLVERAEVWEGGTLSLVEGSVSELVNAGTLSASGGQIESLQSSGTTSLGAMEVGAVTVADGVLAAEGTTFLGTLAVDGGTVALDGCGFIDAGDVQLLQRGGSVRATSLDLRDTGVGDAHVGLRVEGGGLTVEGLSVAGFGGGAVQITGGEVDLEDAEVAGTCVVQTAGLVASTLDCDSVEVVDSDVDLSDVRATWMTAEGGSLTLSSATFGDLDGTALHLIDVDAVIADLYLSDIDGELVVTPVDGGGWTEQEIGGTALLVEGGTLAATDVTIYDTNYGLELRDTEAAFVDLSIERTWHAGLLATDSILSVDALRMNNGRGWGVVGTRSDIDFVEPYIADLDMERRTVEIFDEEGMHVDNVLSMVSDPAIATWGCQLRLEEPTLRDLAHYAIYWNASHDDARLEVTDGAIADADGHGVFAWVTGERASISLDGLDVQDVDGTGVLLYGIANTVADLRDLELRGVLYDGLSATGIGTVRLSGLSVSDTGTAGVKLDSVLDLTAGGIDVAETDDAGISLREVGGVLYKVSVNVAGGEGIKVARSDLSMVDGKIRSTPTGLSCDEDTTLTTCGGFTFEGVATVLDGCPDSCTR